MHIEVDQRITDAVVMFDDRLNFTFPLIPLYQADCAGGGRRVGLVH